MPKLWEKNYTLNTLMERFTVGDDYILDHNLVKADCIASLAHATMLESIGILTSLELSQLQQGLTQIITLHNKGEFTITLSQEDCHTAIEQYLTTNYGEVGKKIHTGRSRNDQVLAALRLYSRDFLLQFVESSTDLIESLLSFAKTHQQIPMPGRTHMQIAMPSSVGLWAAAFAEELIDDLRLVNTAYEVNNVCPLGSAASYGVPLPLNREMVADLLGFARVQNNVLYANNSRGKMESIILDALEHIMLTLSKMSQDLILFSMPEFAYFSLPDELCTGSSIMPQKKNPDGLELLRARTSTVAAYNAQIKNIMKALPSGYNRDFQETKAPFIKGVQIVISSVRIMTMTVQKLQVNPDKLIAGFTPEIYATDAALELVAQGMNFRDAYKEIGLHIDQLGTRDPRESINAKTSTGTTGNLRLDKAHNDLAACRKKFDSESQLINSKLIALLGSNFCNVSSSASETPALDETNAPFLNLYND